ncbi:cytochrome P450 [Mycena haematopus]|nr:cytochrome P450 [Mycena haematopus]
MASSRISLPPFPLATVSPTAILWAAVIATCLTVVPLIFRKNIVSRNGLPIPSGPLFRYAFLRKYPERATHAWAKVYGPLYSVWMGNQLFVVISDSRIARDLLVTQGAIFSGRKEYFMKSHTILAGRAITGSTYNDKCYDAKGGADYADVLDYEANILVRSLYRACGDGTVSVEPVSYALVLAMEFMDLTGPWSNAIDFIPLLQWIPSRMKTRGRKLNTAMVEVYGAMYLKVKDRITSGEAVPDCLVKHLIETADKEKLDWEDTCMLAAAFTLGGVHSISGMIQWFIAILPSHPEVLARAHEELDRVIGRDQPPTTADEARLPYVRAVIKELQRVHPPFWMGTPHYSTEDYEYNGVFIPKDTVVVLNLYTLHHNEERYPDSYTFNPDRYMDDHLSCAESAKLSDPNQRDHWAFGAGRRFCPGVVMAEQELWLAISRILWAFTVHSLPSEPISLEEYEGRSGRTPLPFKVRFTPRHDRVGKFLENVTEITL